MVQYVDRQLFEMSVSEIELQHSAVGAGAELGVTMISDTFDIVMANRIQQRWMGKSGAALLGRKCYREYEKREDVCQGCPGVAALGNGKPHKSQRIGVPDEGAPYKTVASAYPVFDPGGKPIGFVEIVERVLELEELENAMVVIAGLQARLAAAGTLGWILRYSLDAALSMHGVDMGCAFLVDSSADRWQLLSNRGFPAASVQSALAESPSSPGKRHRASLPEPCPLAHNDGHAQGTCVIVPILDGPRVLGRLLLGTTHTPTFPTQTLVALTSIGAMASLATNRLPA